MENNEYWLARTAFQMLSFDEADKQLQQSNNQTEEERFRHLNYLMSVAWRFLGESWPKMDKTFFKMRKR